MSELADLQRWNIAYWGNWGPIRIHTLDTEGGKAPGWEVSIDLRGTTLENASFAPVSEGQMDEPMSVDPEDNFLHCKVEDKLFAAWGDPGRLVQMLSIFIEWARNNDAAAFRL